MDELRDKKCHKCKCCRYPSDFIKNDRILKTCIECSELLRSQKLKITVNMANIRITVNNAVILKCALTVGTSTFVKSVVDHKYALIINVRYTVRNAQIL